MYQRHIHDFRSLAICGIVGAHALHNFTWPADSMMFRIVDTICNESSIWFFFIAGFLFQYLSSRFNTKKYYKSKLKNVIAPYLVMSLPALMASMYWVQQEVPDGFYDYPDYVQAILFLLTGKHLAPFWFVPTISLIYLLGPLLVKADRKVWPYLALPPLVVLSAYLGRDGLLIELQISGLFSPFSKAIYLFSVYTFGMFCSRFHETLLSMVAKYHWPLLAAFVAMFYIRVEGGIPGIYTLYVVKILSCPLLVYYLSLAKDNTFAKISYLGTASFGLFFIHGYVLQAMRLFHTKVLGEAFLPEGSLPGYLVLLIAAIILSTLSIWIAQKLFRDKSRMVVGC